VGGWFIVVGDILRGHRDGRSLMEAVTLGQSLAILWSVAHRANAGVRACFRQSMDGMIRSVEVLPVATEATEEVRAR